MSKAASAAAQGVDIVIEITHSAARRNSAAVSGKVNEAFDGWTALVKAQSFVVL